MIYIDNESSYSQRIFIPRDEAPTASTTGHTFSLQKKDYEITENGLIRIHPDAGYDGISGGSIGVYVTEATGVTPTHLNVSEDGIYVPTGDTVYTGVTVEVHDAAYQEGFEDGYTVGYNEGYSSGRTDGYQEGYTSGSTDGYASGRTDGYQEGYTSGSTDGFASGYTSGTTDGYASGSTDGFNSGYTSGCTDGYSSGRTDGFNAGYASGMTDGYASGYTDGYASGSTDGYTSGVTYQKSLLTSETFTRNGIYTREDGWNSVNVEYPVFSIGFGGIDHNGRYTYDFQQMMGFEGAWNNISFDVAVPQTGGTGVLDSLTVTQNNTSYYPPQGVDGYSAVTVSIDESQVYQDGYNAGYSSGYTSGVTYQRSLLSAETFTTNGTYTRPDGLSSVTVSVVNEYYVLSATAVTKTANQSVSLYYPFSLYGKTNNVKRVRIEQTGEDVTASTYVFATPGVYTLVYYTTEIAPVLKIEDSAFTSVNIMTDSIDYLSIASPDNKSLSSVTFDVNTNVIYIPRAFCNLTIAEPTGSLHDIVIPNSVRNIGDRAFSEGCLRSVVIGENVDSIAYKAFSSNSNLSSITSYSTTAPDLGSLVFDGISSSGTLYVPSSSISSYTNNWLPALPSGWTISTI